MLTKYFPLAVRLIGFSVDDERMIAESFASGHGKAYEYICLKAGNLRDPDIYIANGDDLRALIKLTGLRPCEARPALLVGQPVVDLPYPRIACPLDWHRFFEMLDGLAEKRANALSHLEAAGIITVPERRRRVRLDLDLTDPAEYEKMRAPLPDGGAVLVVDKSQTLSDHLSELLVRYKVPVAWAGNEAQAIGVCGQCTIAVVLINTSTPDINPYRLCRAIKRTCLPLRVAVVFLLSRRFVYSAHKADSAGADGYLNKPMASHHIIAALRKFISLGH